MKSWIKNNFRGWCKYKFKINEFVDYVCRTYNISTRRLFTLKVEGDSDNIKDKFFVSYCNEEKIPKLTFKSYLTIGQYYDTYLNSVECVGLLLLNIEMMIDRIEGWENE